MPTRSLVDAALLLDPSNEQYVAFRIRLVKLGSRLSKIVLAAPALR
jgi:hypothetical protein